eukprot:gb/GECG01003712.1/.p1 GENE.gb/GECG01003712.1/~~gb/GECG01003712.1/.p1  ORF type:complete len:823 (+),score=62.08 gb/GECG01003712.1/:1-2469(+)
MEMVRARLTRGAVLPWSTAACATSASQGPYQAFQGYTAVNFCPALSGTVSYTFPRRSICNGIPLDETRPSRRSEFEVAKKAIQQCQSFDQLIQILTVRYPWSIRSFHHVLTALGAVAHHKHLRNDTLSAALRAPSTDATGSEYQLHKPMHITGLNFLLIAFASCLEKHLRIHGMPTCAADGSPDVEAYMDDILSTLSSRRHESKLDSNVQLGSRGPKDLLPDTAPVYIGYAAHVVSRLRGTATACIYALGLGNRQSPPRLYSETPRFHGTSGNSWLFLEIYSLVVAQISQIHTIYVDNETPEQVSKTALAVAHSIRPWNAHGRTEPRDANYVNIEACFNKGKELLERSVVNMNRQRLNVDAQHDKAEPSHKEDTERIRSQLAVLRACTLCKLDTIYTNKDYHDLLEATVRYFLARWETHPKEASPSARIVKDIGNMVNVLASQLHMMDKSIIRVHIPSLKYRKMLRNLVEGILEGRTGIDEPALCYWLPVFMGAAQISWFSSLKLLQYAELVCNNHPDMLFGHWSASQLANVHSYAVDMPSSRDAHLHSSTVSRTVRMRVINAISRRDRIMDLKAARLERLLLEWLSDSSLGVVRGAALLRIVSHVTLINEKVHRFPALVLQQARISYLARQLLYRRSDNSSAAIELCHTLDTQHAQLRRTMQNLRENDNDGTKLVASANGELFADVYKCLKRSGFHLPELPAGTSAPIREVPCVPGEGSPLVSSSDGFMMDFAFGKGVNDVANCSQIVGIKLFDPSDIVQVNDGRRVLLSNHGKQYLRILHQTYSSRVHFIDPYSWQRLGSMKNKRQFLRKMLCDAGVPFR